MAKSKAKWEGGAGPRRTSIGRLPKIEVFKARVDDRGSKKAGRLPKKAGLWYFHLVAGNGEIVAQSEGYTRRYTAQQGAKRALALSALLSKTSVSRGRGGVRRRL